MQELTRICSNGWACAHPDVYTDENSAVPPIAGPQRDVRHADVHLFLSVWPLRHPWGVCRRCRGEWRIELLLLADAADGGAGSGPFRPGRRCHWRADRRAPRWHRGGLLAGAHLLYIGGYTGLAGAIAVPLTGAWPDSSQERVISPAKALFVGMFAPILHMGVILICANEPDRAVELVNLIGLPMVLTNSISIAIFTTMLRALRSPRSGDRVRDGEGIPYRGSAPHLKQGLTYRTAQAVATLARELKTTAVAITDTERFLAHAGAASRTIDPGEEITSDLTKNVIATGELRIIENAEDIQPRHPALGAAILVPMIEGHEIVGVIQFYFKRPRIFGASSW